MTSFNTYKFCLYLKQYFFIIMSTADKGKGCSNHSMMKITKKGTRGSWQSYTTHLKRFYFFSEIILKRYFFEIYSLWEKISLQELNKVQGTSFNPLVFSTINFRGRNNPFSWQSCFHVSKFGLNKCGCNNLIKVNPVTRLFSQYMSLWKMGFSL